MNGLLSRLFKRKNRATVDASPPPGMRSWQEIQTAHDVLVQVLSGELGVVLKPEDVPLATAACDVLCWVLKHENNPNFQHDLDMIKTTLSGLGFELNFYSTPVSREEIDRMRTNVE